MGPWSLFLTYRGCEKNDATPQFQAREWRGQSRIEEGCRCCTSIKDKTMTMVAITVIQWLKRKNSALFQNQCLTVCHAGNRPMKTLVCYDERLNAEGTVTAGLIEVVRSMVPPFSVEHSTPLKWGIYSTFPLFRCYLFWRSDRQRRGWTKEGKGTIVTTTTGLTPLCRNDFTPSTQFFVQWLLDDTTYIISSCLLERNLGDVCSISRHSNRPFAKIPACTTS